MEKPFKMMPFEALLEIVLNNDQNSLRARELAKQEIERREKAFRKSIEDALAEIEEDERLRYPTATVDVNAPLALIQNGLEAQVRALKYVLTVLDVKDGGKVVAQEDDEST